MQTYDEGKGATFYILMTSTPSFVSVQTGKDGVAFGTQVQKRSFYSTIAWELLH